MDKQRVADEILSSVHGAEMVPPPTFCRYTRYTDEELSAPYAVRPPIGYCFVTDEELPASDHPAPQYGCVTDEELSAAPFPPFGFCR
ncbi:MAG: hypothetical protein IH626_03140 [Rhodospirillales bacterium]|nr:hypothetical protein [Rhodospirillales bacterium]